MVQRNPRFTCYMVVLLALVGVVLAGCDSDDGFGEVDLGPNAPARPTFLATNLLTADDVRTIIAQAVTQAVASNFPVTVVVVDRSGAVLGAFQMDGALTMSTIDRDAAQPGQGPLDQGLELVQVPAALAALSKADTAAFFQTSGAAFTTRTASDIIQEHRPRGVAFTFSGPLFGVQFSSLPCSDIKNNPPAPLGLAGDAGGIPLYKDGQPVGAIGVEGDGNYTVDRDPFDDEEPLEELIAVAGTRGFEAAAAIRATTILLDGVRLPFVNVDMPDPLPLIAFDDLPGQVIPIGIPAAQTFFFDGTIRDTPAIANPNLIGFAQTTLAGLPVRMAVDANGTDRFPIRDSVDPPPPVGLSAAEVEQILLQAVQRAFKDRAAIRQPATSFVQVNIFVVDAAGNVLGYRGTLDAPFFGFDVAAQKARTAAFFSNVRARPDLLAVGLQNRVNAALADGLGLDGSIAFSDRGAGFLNRPFLPDGQEGTEAGPFSVPIEEFSPFHVGLQLELVQNALLTLLTSPNLQADVLPLLGNCAGIAGLNNGIQIFAGSVPVYRDRTLIGGVGVSGDGIDQDDHVADSGSAGFRAPEDIRSDTVIVRDARLPFVRFPINPEQGVDEGP